MGPRDWNISCEQGRTYRLLTFCHLGGRSCSTSSSSSSSSSSLSSCSDESWPSPLSSSSSSSSSILSSSSSSSVPDSESELLPSCFGLHFFRPLETRFLRN